MFNMEVMIETIEDRPGYKSHVILDLDKCIIIVLTKDNELYLLDNGWTKVSTEQADATANKCYFPHWKSILNLKAA